MSRESQFHAIFCLDTKRIFCTLSTLAARRGGYTQHMNVSVGGCSATHWNMCSTTIEQTPPR